MEVKKAGKSKRCLYQQNNTQKSGNPVAKEKQHGVDEQVESEAQEVAEPGA